MLEAAARFLEARSRSVAEVRRRLTSAGYRTELVDGAIARMTDLGMLDDETFARAWVESRDRARPRGERALQNELRLKGIDRAVVDLVLGARRSAEASDAAPGSRRRANDSWRSTPGRSTGSPIRDVDASAPTRCWPATASTPRRAGSWPPASRATPTRIRMDEVADRSPRLVR